MVIYLPYLISKTLLSLLEMAFCLGCQISLLLICIFFIQLQGFQSSLLLPVKEEMACHSLTDNVNAD